MAMWGPTAKFSSCQYFRLYSKFIVACALRIYSDVLYSALVLELRCNISLRSLVVVPQLLHTCIKIA